MSRTYFEIPTSVLYGGSVAEFDVYLRGLDGYVLYAAKGVPFEKKLLDGLASAYVESVYVSDDDESFYREYISKNLVKFANDESLERGVKSKLMYDVTRSVMKRMFEKEELPEAVADVKGAAEVIMDDILRDDRAFLSFVKASSYDYYTYTHCINVAIYAMGIGKFIDMTPCELKALAYGAILHDIGKSMVNPEILNKEGKLDDEEFRHIKKHAPMGFDILMASIGESDERVLSAVRHHHEKLDGSGYPDGLRGNEISLFAKIVAIADVFDALNTKRSYKEPMSTFDTLLFMKKIWANT